MRQPKSFKAVKAVKAVQEVKGKRSRRRRFKGIQMTRNNFLKLAIDLLSGPKARFRMNKVNLVSEIEDIYWVPDVRRVETAKKLVEEGYLEIEQMKDYLAGDWN